MQPGLHLLAEHCAVLNNMLLICNYVFFSIGTTQRSAKVLVRGLVKCVPALALLAGTNFTKPRTKTLANVSIHN